MTRKLSDKELMKVAMEQTAQLLDRHSEAQIKDFLAGKGRLQVVPAKPTGKHARRDAR